jgi:hypothetical protein
MFAARPLHPAKADISGSPSDVAEGPTAEVITDGCVAWVCCTPCGDEQKTRRLPCRASHLWIATHQHRRDRAVDEQHELGRTNARDSRHRA